MPIKSLPFRLAPPGADIRGDVWTTTDAMADTAILVCHGFKGFKDWGFFPYLCEQLTQRLGITVVSFNFDGSGVRETDFDDLSAFAHNTFSRELWDLEAILDGLAYGKLGDLTLPPSSRFGLLGHSRGGATCLLKAGLRAQVSAVVTWAAISSVTRYEGYREIWESGETVIIPNARTGQDMLLDRNVLDDMRANRERLDVLASAASLTIPCAVIHGSEDEAVPFGDAEEITHAIGNSAQLVRIMGAGHTFGAIHPFEGTTPELETAIDASVELFRDVFG